MDALKQLVEGQLKAEAPEVVVGDTVKVHVNIREGEREREREFRFLKEPLSQKTEAVFPRLSRYAVFRMA